MIGASVLLARRAATAARLSWGAPRRSPQGAGPFRGRGYERQPPAFNAIFFRNLLMLHDVRATRACGPRSSRRSAVTRTARARRRDRRDRFHFSKGGVTLLDQSAIVQVFALLAWDPRAYGRLA